MMKNWTKLIPAIAFCTLFLNPLTQAQTLNANGELNQIEYNGSYQDFTIPSGGSLNSNDYVIFSLKGADGGKTQLTNQNRGGGGATVEVGFEIGTGPGQLQPGGTVRVIIGQDGKNGRNSGGESGSGGGGGTGLLYHDPSASITCSSPSTNIADAGSCWVILAVAGGGGGACEDSPGRNGTADLCGQDGRGGNLGGTGGCNGQGGDAGDASSSANGTGGGGGGYLTNGGGSDVAGRGKAGGFTGGDGGGSGGKKRRGGFGYGGGASGNLNLPGGGGGGGYSGGGGGGKSDGGGGGGSFANNAAIENDKENGELDGTPNTGRFYYEFTVFDLTQPKAICKDISVTLVNGSYTLNASEIDDNSIADEGESIVPAILRKIAGVNVPVSTLSLDCGDVGEKLITLQVISTSGKKDKCGALVQILDDVAPTVSCGTPFPLAAFVTRGQPYVLDPNLIIESSGDACGQIIDTYLSQDIFTCEDVGSNTVTVYVEDESGNVGSCNYTLSLGQDPEALGLTCPADISVDIPTAAHCEYELGEEVLPDLMGPCSSTLTYEISDGAGVLFSGSETAVGVLLPAGNFEVSYTHSLDNTTYNCSFQVTVNDLFNSYELLCPPNFETDVQSPSCTYFISASQLAPASTGLCAPDHLLYQIENAASGITGSGSGFLPDTYFEIGLNTITYSLGYNSCSFQIEAFDNEDPEAFCVAPFSVQLDGNCEATVAAADLEFGSYDNCGDVTVAAFYSDCSAGPCTDIGPVSSITFTNPGEYDVILEITDPSGNTDNCSVALTVEGAAAPMANCQDITRTLDANGQHSIIPSDVFDVTADNCSAASPLQVMPSDFDCSHIGDNVVTLTVENSGGSTATCTATVTIEDSTPPSFVTVDQTFSLDANGEVTVQMSDLVSMLGDNCGVDEILGYPNSGPIELQSSFDFSCDDLGEHLFFAYVTDFTGNSNPMNVTITIVDDTPPNAVCRNRTKNLDADGLGTIGANFVFDGASTDNCGAPTAVAVGPNQFDCDDLGQNTVTLTVEDGSGNQSTCTATVTVRDQINPSIDVDDVTVPLDANGEATVMLSDLIIGLFDNCSAEGFGYLDYEGPTQLKTSFDFSCDDLGANNIILFAEDPAGNTDYESSIVTIVDDTPPTAACTNATIPVVENGMVTITFDDIDNGSWDNCGIDAVNISQTQFSCDDIGDNSVSLTLTDGSGNTSSCTAMVTIYDNVLPYASCVPALTIHPDENGQAILTPQMLDAGASDNCGTVTLTFVDGSTEKMVACDAGSFSEDLLITDDSGNQNGCSTTITVEDNMPPTASCKVFKKIFADENGQATLSPEMIDNGSTDNCGAVTLEFENGATEIILDCDAFLELTILYVTDYAGNQSSCVSQVTVDDEVPPQAVCQDFTAQLDENGTITIFGTALDGGSTDNCSSATGTGIYEFDCDDIGENPVTLTVRDVPGNTSTCQATVTVEDNLPPNAVCTNISRSIGLDGTVNIIPSSVFASQSSDNCGDVTPVAIDINVFTCDDLGDNTVTLTVEDSNGNQSTCSSTVYVEDITPPTANCVPLLTLPLDENGQAVLTADMLDDGSTDDCGSVNFSFYDGSTSMSFTCAEANTTIFRSLKVMDGSGNVNFCDTEISIVDNTPPNVVCQPITVYLDENGEVSFSTNLFDGGSTDNCGSVSSDFTATLDCNAIGTNSVLVIFNDGNGNSGTCQTTYTVVDNIPPVANCKSNSVIIYLDENGEATLTPSMLDDGSSDNCGSVSLFFGDDATSTTFSCSDVYSVQSQELVVKDAQGNQNTCFGSVEVRDNIAPTAVCQNITVALGSDGAVFVSGEDLAGGSYDNCDNGIDFNGSYTFSCLAIGVHNVEVGVIDAFSNASSCLAKITVIDDTPPTPVCLDQTVVFNGESIQIIPAADLFDAVNSMDNCGGVFLSDANTDVVIECDDVGSVIPVTVTAEDDAGMEVSCTANITVEGLPCDWQDIGGIGCYDGLNTSSYDPLSGTYNMMANNCAPEFPYSEESTAFISMEMCGDGEIVAEVTSVDGVGYAGVMMRDDLSPNAPMVAMGTNRVNRVRKQVRILPGYPAWPQQILSYDKFWVKITRTGNMFQAYASTDGSLWTPYLNQQVMMANNCLQVGLYAYSEKPGTPLSATFTNVYATGQGIPLVGLPESIEMGAQVEVLPNIQVYPNPTQDVVYIDLRDYPDQRAEVQLFNGFGQQVLRQKVEASVEQLDVSALAPGVYSVVTQIGDSRLVRRLVIARE